MPPEPIFSSMTYRLATVAPIIDALPSGRRTTGPVCRGRCGAGEGGNGAETGRRLPDVRPPGCPIAINGEPSSGQTVGARSSGKRRPHIEQINENSQ